MNPDRLAELEEERSFLLRSLSDLDREHAAGDVSDDDYETLRDDYTTRAAGVLRSIESGRATLPARRKLSGAQWLIGVVASVVIAGAIFAVLKRSVEDDTAAVATAPSPAAELCPPSPTAELNTLLVDGRTALATDARCAFELFTQAFKTDPTNVEATTYLGWVIAFDAMSSGMEGDEFVSRGEQALVLLDRARELDSAYPDAQCFTAIVRFRFLGDAEGAKDPLERCRAGDLPAEVAPLVEQLGTRIDAELAGPATT